MQLRPVVDEFSQKSVATAKTSLQKEPGFVKFTMEEPFAKTWCSTAKAI